MWLSFPVKGALAEEWTPEPPAPEGTLEVFDFKKLKVETLGQRHFRLQAVGGSKAGLLFARTEGARLEGGRKGGR